MARGMTKVSNRQANLRGLAKAWIMIHVAGLWAARYDTWLRIVLMPKGIVCSFLLFLLLDPTSNGAQATPEEECMRPEWWGQYTGAKKKDGAGASRQRRTAWERAQRQQGRGKTGEWRRRRRWEGTVKTRAEQKRGPHLETEDKFVKKRMRGKQRRKDPPAEAPLAPTKLVTPTLSRVS